MSLERLRNINIHDPYFAEVLRKIVTRVSALEPRAEVFIFGSFVSGRFTAESDLDIAVIIPDHWSQRAFLEKIYAQGILSSWPLDLLVFKKTFFLTKKNLGGVCVDIAESGIELYPKWSLHEPLGKKI